MAKNNDLTKNILGLILNLFFPGVGSLVSGRINTGIIQLVLWILGLLASLTLFGAIIGVPMIFAAWLWAVIESALEFS